MGGKKLPTSSVPTIPNPLTRHLHMEGRRRRSKADGEEGNENCREMEKVLNGKKKGEEESGWPEKERKNVKDAFLTLSFRQKSTTLVSDTMQ